MYSRVKHSIETRFEASRLFDAGFGSDRVASKLAMSKETARQWRDQYRQGRLLDSGAMGNKKFSRGVKVAAVEKFLAGSTKTEVMDEFGITTRAMLYKWVAIYRREGAGGLEPKRVGRKPRQQQPESLEEENERLRMENAILKKWVALAQEEDQRLSGR